MRHPAAHAAHLHAERLADGRDLPADGAIAQDEYAPPGEQQRRRARVALAPVALAQQAVKRHDELGRSKHERQRKFGGGDVIVVQVVQIDVWILLQQLLHLQRHAGIGHDHGAQRWAGVEPLGLGGAVDENVAVGGLGIVRRYGDADIRRHQRAQLVDPFREIGRGDVHSKE